jgi:hypothetical protein
MLLVVVVASMHLLLIGDLRGRCQQANLINVDLVRTGACHGRGLGISQLDL